MISHFLRFALILSLAVTAPAFAEDGGGGDYGGRSGSGSAGGSAGGFSSGVTKSVVRIINRGIKDCTSIDSVYRYDCYRLTYKLATDRITGIPAYAPAQKALAKVQSTLETIVDRNVDTTVPRKRKGLQTYKAIKPAAVASSKRQFTSALNQAETTLLRSPDSGTDHFTRIAAAVNSNKVLLRSALKLLARILFA